MARLRIGILDLVCNTLSRSHFERLLVANTTSIMPQAIAIWCEQEGHEVEYCSYLGSHNLISLIPEDVDLVFISSFTHTAQLAYALSNLYRTHGAVTVLGGPHARSYPSDALRYFDYVVGFSDRDLIREILDDFPPPPGPGKYLCSERQPDAIPGVRERWDHLQTTTQQARYFKMVPMLSSVGCPYACDFCTDADVPYQPLDLDGVKDDLRFLLQTRKRPRVIWFDPNFAVQFNNCLDALEEVVPPGSIDFIGETSLSLLQEPRVKRLGQLGFKAILTGLESWTEYRNKSGLSARAGVGDHEETAHQVNMILRHIPYLCVNFIIGLDSYSGPEAFEMTKAFIDLAPGVYPAQLFLIVYGRNAPGNFRYQEEGRVLPLPFHFLNPRQITNVRPKHYSWIEFYDQVIDLLRYSFSARVIYKRVRTIQQTLPKSVGLIQSLSTGGLRKLRYQRRIRSQLEEDRQFRDYFEQESEVLPSFFIDQIQRDLGPLWEWLPPGALYHDVGASLPTLDAYQSSPVRSV